MKKNNLLKLLGIALIVAIVSMGIFYGLFVGKLTSSQGSGKTLVVAAHALKVGTQLQSTDLKTIPWPVRPIAAGLLRRRRINWWATPFSIPSARASP